MAQEVLKTPSVREKLFSVLELRKSLFSVSIVGSSQQAVPQAAPRRRHRSKPQTSAASARQEQQQLNRRSIHNIEPQQQQQQQQQQHKQQQQPTPIVSSTTPPQIDPNLAPTSMAVLLKRALRIEGPNLVKKTVAIKKNVRESLGMRIGGGIGSNEGDTPIYIANIHPHGCIGKSKQMKVKGKTYPSSIVDFSKVLAGHLSRGLFIIFLPILLIELYLFNFEGSSSFSWYFEEPFFHPFVDGLKILHHIN